MEAYQRSLQEHYAITTAVQAFVLVGTGDLIAQIIELSSEEEASSEDSPVSGDAAAGLAAAQEALLLPADGHRSVGGGIDPMRTLRMGTLGLIIGGIGTSHWLQYLESRIPGHASSAVVLGKATLDACFWAPIANGAYLVLTPLLEGKDGATVKEKVLDEFEDVMKTELLTFFPYNLVSFSVVPPLLRPFTTGFVSMCFGVYISWVTHRVSRATGGGGTTPGQPPAHLPAAAGTNSAAYQLCLESPDLDECDLSSL